MRPRIALLMVVALLAAGCGGGEEDTTPAQSATTPPTRPTTTPPTTQPAADVAAETGTDTRTSTEVDTIEMSREVDPDQLQSIVDTWGEQLGVPVLAASVRSPDGTVTSVDHFADGQAPTEPPQFLIGSIGKTMTAATTMLLVENGVLDLDTPIERWLPDFPRADEITLRLLLAHRSGLARRDLVSGLEPSLAALATFEDILTPSELLSVAADSVGDEPLPAPFAYSNPAYHVVGAVIEAATGQSLADVMEARIFEPLAMTDTFLAWPEQVDRLVPGHLLVPEDIVIPLSTAAARGASSQSWASGGQVSTTADVATFFGEIDGDLLSAASVEEMTTPLPGAPHIGLGIDEFVWPDIGTGWGHAGGGVTGQTCVGVVTGDGWSGAVCMNRFDVESIADPDASEIWDIYRELIASTGPQS